MADKSQDDRPNSVFFTASEESKMCFSITGGYDEKDGSQRPIHISNTEKNENFAWFINFSLQISGRKKENLGWITSLSPGKEPKNPFHEKCFWSVQTKGRPNKGRNILGCSGAISLHLYFRVLSGKNRFQINETGFQAGFQRKLLKKSRTLWLKPVSDSWKLVYTVKYSKM